MLRSIAEKSALVAATYRPLEKSDEIRSAVATISFRTDSR